MKPFLLAFCTCVFLIPSFSQKKIAVTVILAKNMQADKIKINFDNGVNAREIKTAFVNNRFSFSDSCFSDYGHIGISYPLKKEENTRPYFSFFLDEHPAIINFTIPDVSSGLPEATSTNVATFNTGPIAKMLDSTFMAIDMAYSTSVAKIVADSTLADSAMNLINRQLAERMHSKLDLLSKHGDNYYAFWLFKTELVPGAAYNFDDRLITVFNSVFSDSLKNSFDGRQTWDRLQQRAFVKHKSSAPFFSTKDIKGNIVNMNRLKGKYVLIDFWSTHCIPCIERMPFLKKLREKYPKEKLEIISICTNNDSAGFARISKKQGISWTSIFGNHDVAELYNIGPIPAIYLINPEGNSAFNYMEEAEEKIEEILTTALK